jgi:hypothetical protein
MGAITDLSAGVPVSDLDAGIDWYTRLFGRPPNDRVGDEAVTGLDALLERLTAAGIDHEPIETYSNGVCHVDIPDPDGNVIAVAEPPSDAA